MNLSAPFIARPIGTILLALGVLLSGIVAYGFLPVAPLPSVDIPTIVVFANRPGAEPETMATSIAAPLERRLGEIPGVTELTSTSGTGTATIVVQFDIARDIDGAAHDVQAAINAATADIPGDLPTRPYFRKFNPALAPIMTIALTSDTLPLAALYDAADTVLAQRLAQVAGVAQVQVNGAAKPAVRVQLDPSALAAAGLSGQAVNTAIKAANVNGPVGGFDGPERAETIGLNGQINTPEDYAGLVLRANGPAATRIEDVGHAVSGTANARIGAWSGTQPAILLNITRLADANVIETVDAVRAVLPRLRTYLPAGIDVTVLREGTATIRASVADIMATLAITIGLVLLVVLLFMRRLVPIIAAAVTIPLSIAGTLAAMWWQGFSLDNFSLMALTISVGFVVDDAIVMIENIVRHVEQGETPLRAALLGSRQIGFTVLSISISLVAVFIPILFLGGVLGRLFHEFAATLTLAIAISAAVSLTLTPMLCGQFLPAAARSPESAFWRRVDRGIEGALGGLRNGYARTLGWALRRRRLMLAATIATVALTIWLYGQVPKGFMPTQDTGLIGGSTLASPDISYAAMVERQRAVVDVLLADPAVDTVSSTVSGTTGFNPQLNRGHVDVALKPLDQRGYVSSEGVIARLRPKLAQVGGVQTSLYSAQDLRGGGRDGGSNQFVLIAQDLRELRTWAARLQDALRAIPILADISSDQDRAGPQVTVQIDRVAAGRLGVTVAAIDEALSNAFSQRQVSIVYTQRNQYWVVLEADPALQTDPTFLDRIRVPGSSGQVPLAAVTRVVRDTAPLAVRHQGQFPAATLSFNTVGNTSLGEATAAIEQAVLALRMPPTVRTDFAGNARFFADSLSTVPLLIVAALGAIYVILGVLYESLTQPLTILSTLPSAGLGALLALLATGYDLSIIAIIGILLLIGIVKKNAIMLVDFALEQERMHGRPPIEAIREACLERFRPIIMTTLAALLGAVPLAIASGTGSELRQPLGIAIVGGLVVSQMLTLYTTPVVYLALQGRRRWAARLCLWGAIIGLTRTSPAGDRSGTYRRGRGARAALETPRASGRAVPRPRPG